MFSFLQRFFKPQKPQLQTFILEPILTPSGLVDGGDDVIDLDIDLPDLPEFQLETEDIEVIPFFDTDYPDDMFDGGVFTVGETGEVTIDFLYDGGGYEGELAIFSLDGMGELEPGSNEFIRVAVERALSESELGHVLITDAAEGARFSGELGEADRNSGDYLGLKTVQMRAGDQFAVMLIPHGTVEDVDEVLSNGESLRPKMRPLFSLATANPQDDLQLGQIADVDGSGSTFVMEDLRLSSGGDRDYNDIIFQFKGAVGEAIELEEVIEPGQDWRETETGEALLDYTRFDGEEIEIATELPENVQNSLNRAVDLDIYDSEALGETTKWVVGVGSQEISPDILTLLEAENIGATRHIPNTYVWEFAEDLTQQQVQQRLGNLKGVEFAYPLVEYQHEGRLIPNDTFFPNQWHLQNTGQSGGTVGADLNVTSVWDSYQGKGVTIAVVDDGVEYTHPDLQGNYRGDLSRDFNEIRDGVYDIDPQPRSFFGSALDGHGTAIAGLIAAEGNNNLGVSGVAPQADLAALKLIGGPANDLTEADSLSYLRNDIDIYSNSWGPSDDGKTLRGANPLLEMALHAGVNQGRDGLGNIYVWAGGNGNFNGDNVNYDGYANSRYTIAVGAIDHDGNHSGYSEVGSSLFVVAPSGNAFSSITTTDLTGSQGYNDNGDYTNNFNGTSAAAPSVSGVVALMLEANPALSWRDVQHILVETAQKNDPDDPGWVTNAAGQEVNYKYGFGAIDAAAAVAAATTWQAVVTEVSFSSGVQEVVKEIPDNRNAGLKETVTIEEDIIIESVEVIFDGEHPYRGDLEVTLISPDGTGSILAEPHNDDGDDYSQWKFTSLRHWGESSSGDWTLRVADKQGNNVGTWNSWKLNFYGTKPTVTIEATDPDATEGGDVGAFTIRRSSKGKKPLTVNYTLDPLRTHSGTGVATNSEDYQELTGTIEIPAEASEVILPIKTLEDDIAEQPELVTLKLTDDDTYEVGVDNRDTLTVWDNEKPQVQLYINLYNGEPGIYRVNNYTSESGNQGDFHFSRLGSLEEDLTVNYAMTGTAINGQDYEYLPGSVTIEAGKQGSVIFSLKPIDDNEVEGEETAILTTLPSSNYTIRDDWGSRPTTIWDNDNKPTVTITTTNPVGSEYGEPPEVTFTRTGDTTNPLTVDYWIASENLGAKNGVDYEFLPGTIDIQPGESSVTLPIQPIDDNLVEVRERLLVYLRSSSDYVMGATELAIPYIEDNDTQQLAWQDNLATPGYDYGKDINVDNNGNIYLVGRTSGDLTGNGNVVGDPFVASYNSTGEKQWQRQITSEGFDEAVAVGNDGLGSVYVAGWTDSKLKGTGAHRDTWLAKYDSNGNQKWFKPLGNEDYDIANGGMAVDEAGNIYLAGLTYGNLEGINQGETDAWIAKFNPNGRQVWVKQQVIATPFWDEVSDVAVDKKGSIYVTGKTTGKLGANQGGEADAWVAKFNSSGQQQWIEQFGTIAHDDAHSIAVDELGYVYLAGYTRGWIGEAYEGHFDDWIGDLFARGRAIGSDRSYMGGRYYGQGDAWVAQVDAVSGVTNWKRSIGTPQADVANGVAADKSGNVYLTGYTQGKLGDSQSGGKDVFVAKYDMRGALQWKQQLGETGEDVANAIVVGQDGLYLAGTNSGDDQSGDDAWIAKLA